MQAPALPPQTLHWELGGLGAGRGLWSPPPQSKRIGGASVQTTQGQWEELVRETSFKTLLHVSFLTWNS